MTTDEAGFTIEPLQAGKGPVARQGCMVTVHYTGTFADGKSFDSSRERNEPFTFLLGAGQVIRGWDMAVATMKVGDRVKVTIPSALAYGREGYPGVIPPHATLIFDVELLAME